MVSIVSTLGTGSGVDTSALIDSLITAQFENKTKALTAQSTALTAQVSSIGSLKSGITAFASSLKTLISGGTLATQPRSSDASILTVSTLSGAKVGDYSAAVVVKQLAAGQVATATSVDRTVPQGAGTLTFNFGEAVIDPVSGKMTVSKLAGVDKVVTLGADTSLDGIAAAVNAAGIGVRATILTDADGSRLSFRSETGQANAFTVDAVNTDGGTGLARFSVGKGKAIDTPGQVAQDALVSLDGTTVRRPSNAITDLIEGMRLDLTSALPGKTIAITTVRPSATLSTTANDFVEAFNQLRAMIATETAMETGSLRNDPAARDMARQLNALTTTVLVSNQPAGAPRTLAEIGIGTNRDGSLSVDAAKLTAAMTKWPDTVEAMFASPAGSAAGPGAGLGNALQAISDKVTNSVTGLGASATRYAKLQKTLAENQAKATEQQVKQRETMTKQFASMDARVAAYKSTQSFLEQQIDAWNQG